MPSISGFFFFLAGIFLLLGILFAEIFYPNYNISLNMISNLAATPPPDSIIREPSAYIFDISMISSGIIVLIGAFSVKKLRAFSILMMLVGIGAIGVGLFPVFHKFLHSLSALAAFSAGSLAAITSFRFTNPPFRYFSLILGLIALSFLTLGVIFPSTIVPILGRGGTERLVFYPIVVWLIGFGGYIMGGKRKK